MRPFLTSKRKFLDLIVLVVLAAILGFLLGLEPALLFSFGFIWNWVASQDLSQHMEGRSYRYTMLRFVLNVQSQIVSPGFIKRSPEFVKMILRSLPAGLFWSLVIWFQDSDLPIWATFLGSFVFELSQWEVMFRKKEIVP
jgi:hypothetical protein